ncbi:MAG: NADH-quinone oxidoreductase subunit NuoF [Armatimonadota bacterium]|nr:NADH-quinone oxidoreductase subunit NuoF [Armatimonadota bacterium]MDR7533183.1 NADH-quinone oxidoreductase subunit NuoF [Armatimonadota bacterium]MDR7535429.1 NADH-quinone oxidoreductase subunit NuoF [Armatimonadota bacterium]
MRESILLRWTRNGGVHDLAAYRRAGGYEAARRVATGELPPESVIDLLVQSGLRGKGGAGFPTGQKWKFIPRSAPVKYVVVNADEGEPGTFKDRTLLEGCPHLLLEGIIIAAVTVGAQKAYIYLRREFHRARRLLEQAVAQARAAGFIGRRVFGGEHTVEIVVHTGAGAYIAGEESALLESLEGRRALPRLRPPFPAQAGLYQMPTLVNNVETLCHVPAVLALGPERYRELGPPALFSVSGHVTLPGVYELPLGTPLREIIFEHAGGLRPGRRFQAAFPGGSSSMLLTEEHLDVAMDYDSLRAVGSMLGSAAVIVIDDSADMVEVLARIVEFYRDESCGKCTPCREGTVWITQVFDRILHGRGRPEDLALLESIARGMTGTCFCPLGESVPPSLVASLRHFRHGYERHIARAGAPGAPTSGGAAGAAHGH